MCYSKGVTLVTVKGDDFCRHICVLPQHPLKLISAPSVGAPQVKKPWAKVRLLQVLFVLICVEDSFLGCVFCKNRVAVPY